MCITIAVSQIFKLFHAIKFDGQLHGLALRKLDKSVLLRSSMLSRTDFLNFFQG